MSSWVPVMQTPIIVFISLCYANSTLQIIPKILA